MNKDSRSRIRRLVGKLNKTRRRQARQIDILCNDMVDAHGDFIHQLRTTTAVAEYYERIIGRTDLSGIIENTVELVQKHVVDANVVVFLLCADGFELHRTDDTGPIDVETQRFEDLFDDATVKNISRSNWICTMDDMYAMGLDGDCTVLSRVSAAAIPLGRYSPGLGFILVYRSADKELTPRELEIPAAVTSGTTKAITACRTEQTA